MGAILLLWLGGTRTVGEGEARSLEKAPGLCLGLIEEKPPRADTPNMGVKANFLPRLLVRGSLLACALVTAHRAEAFFHVEPGIGYNRGHFQTDKAQGLGLQFKVGIDFQKIFIVADAGYHDLQLGATPTSTFTDVALTLGGDFKAWRAWYSHLASASLVTGTDPSKTTRTGGGYKLGVSGQIGTNAYLNLEARFVDFTKSTTGTTETNVTEFMDGALLSVSWPFSF